MSYVTRKHHAKIVAALNDQIMIERKEREHAQKLQAEAESDRNYYKRSHATECEAHNVLKAEKNKAGDMAEQKKSTKQQALERAHIELARVKPSDTDVPTLQRIVGTAQGILAAVLDHPLATVLYPDDMPPRRRSSDMHMTATEIRHRRGY